MVIKILSKPRPKMSLHRDSDPVLSSIIVVAIGLFLRFIPRLFEIHCDGIGFYLCASLNTSINTDRIPNGILGIGGTYTGSGGDDSDSWWTATILNSGSFSFHTLPMCNFGSDSRGTDEARERNGCLPYRQALAGICRCSRGSYEPMRNASIG